jgi:signal peptidase I
VRTERYHSLRYPVFAAIIAAGALWWWRRPFRVGVEGESMSPTLEPGDLLVAVRFGSVRRDSLVVVGDPRRPGFELVKRVRGVPGETVGDRRLGPEEFWVEGERPEASTDSRTFGPVLRDLIAGVVRIRYWPPSRIGWL